jgi:peptidylprolyl isomerase
MAKSRGATSFGSQWFVNLKDNTGLDYDNSQGDKFYPFAEVVSGMDVVEAIASVPVNNPQEGKPTEPVTITSIEITETPKS